MQLIKDYLVRLGPNNLLVQTALRIDGMRRGYKIDFEISRIRLEKANFLMILSDSQYVQVPFMMQHFDMYFATIEGQSVGGLTILDFSKPALHRYIKSKVGFCFPSIPEDEVMDAYIHEYRPKQGDIVWDVGAHAGATTYALAQMVGPLGKVFAFEPDELNYEYLMRNIESHKLQNVTPVKKALAGTSGTAKFNMDGTMNAGLKEFLTYSDHRFFKTISTITVDDACAELGTVPNFVKMDIEGAEVEVIKAAKAFLSNHVIHFAIESNHRVDNELTSKALERIFPEIGYGVCSSDKYGQMFTWATPNS